MPIRIALFAILAWLAGCTAPTIDYDGPVAGWEDSTGSPGGSHFSPLTQIDPGNVGRLREVWRWTPASRPTAPPGVHVTEATEATPIIVDGTMVVCRAWHQVVALDPLTGKELWSYDPKMRAPMPSHFCRGVSAWKATDAGAGTHCATRILSTSGDGRLFALDARTGTPCADFGTDGQVDMLAGLGPARPDEYYQSSPPLVIGDRVLAGSSVRDGFRSDPVGGVVRAWDVRSGRLVWAWDPVGPGMVAVSAQDAEAGKTFTRGTPNVWSLMSADVERGLVFVPTGNAATDNFKGAARAIDHYGSSVVALEAATGKVVWHFQTVHHDIWDYDVGSQPVLYDHDGTPALALATKQGNVFLLNRLTGAPLFPVQERPVPAGTVEGETSSPTQPFPTLPAPIADKPVTADDLIGWPVVSAGCRETLESLNNQGLYTPVTTRDTLVSPGVAGGFNWGSAAINPQTRIMVAPFLNMPFIARLVPRQEAGDPETDPEPYSWLTQPQYGTPYTVVRRPFLSARNVPCMKPPWGFLVAWDLATGKEIWRRPMGSMRGQLPLVGGLFEIGVPTSGGAIQTASGLVFMAGTGDARIRALDARTGERLWQADLPFPARATPMTFRLSKEGRQYLVIFSGGSSNMDPGHGEALVAFALPE